MKLQATQTREEAPLRDSQEGAKRPVRGKSKKGSLARGKGGRQGVMSKGFRTGCLRYQEGVI